ncbi:uncharacterized protein LOC125573122 [Nematostella vectensis]|uniref:uncharacterized protein LOC125558969 n=1 Tax=Nematostella vectensis TaxID=45351 RepID=UPI0020773B43|nr:uncharacterized protein LOC125558969 [Nematostella vectensis]XP_048589427.1 uncharacterized protein LOC125573122 [Nematostella vectensis]
MAPKMRSSNVLRYIESAGLSEDLSEFESENVSAGSRLATKNETAVHVESTARLYELRLIQMEKFAIREKDTAILFGENSRPFRAATIKTFLEYLGEPKGTKIGSLACKGLAPPSIKALRFWMPKFGHVGPYSEQVKRDHDGKIIDIIPKGNPMEDAGKCLL